MTATARRLILVWALLVAATVASWEIGVGSGWHGAASAIALTVCAIKASAIGLEFMELRHAPPGVTGAFLAWAIGVSLAIGAVLLGAIPA